MNNLLKQQNLEQTSGCFSYLLAQKTKKANTLLEKFRKHIPEIPASYYLELLILQENNSDKYQEKLENYANKFPDYAFIRFLQLENQIATGSFSGEYVEQNFNRESFYSGRSSLHEFEIITYLIFKLFLLGINNNATRLEAFYFAYAEIDLPNEDHNILDRLVLMAKLQFVIKQLIQ